MLVTLILRGILWVCDRVIRVTRPVVHLESWAFQKWAERQPKQAVKPATRTIYDLAGKAVEVYDWAEDEGAFGDPGLPVHYERCPVCEHTEFPLTPYDGVRMCLSCKDDAVISDRTVGGYLTVAK